MKRLMLFVFVIATAFPLSVNAVAGGALTRDLGLGSEGEQVSLLQSWLAKDEALYPEGMVNGAYGQKTKAAVQRYQKKTGAISDAAEYGSVRTMTRAALNAEFAPEQNGLAWIRGEYGNALLWNGSVFTPLTAQEYKVSGDVLKTISAWVYPARLSARTAILFDEGGYGIGFEGGRIYAKALGSEEVITAGAYLKEGEWHHVSVIFTGSNAIFLYDDIPVEAGALVKKKVSFFGKLFSFLSPNEGEGPARPSAAPETGAEVAEKQQQPPRGFFSAVSRFFSTLGGTLSRIASLPETEIPKQPESSPDTSSVPPIVSDPLARSSEPAYETKKQSENEARETGDAESVDSLIATTTATSSAAIGETATSTASSTLAFDGSATSTATTTGEVALAGSATAMASTTPETAPKAVIGGGGGGGGRGDGGGGGGGGGSAPPPPEPEPENKPPTITLTGRANTELSLGVAFTDPGATASDPEDGDISSSIVATGTVNTFNVGTYTLSYGVADSKGLAASAVSRTVTVNPPAALPPEAQEPAYTLAPLGEPASLSISSSKDADPKFSHADITPLHVYVGQTQTLSVTVSSAEPITSVTATTNLDTQTLTLNLQETGTDSVSGGKIFSTSWTVFDTHVTTYRTTFTATNQSGQSNSITLAWSDPCSGIVQGANSSISANCTVSTTDGLDAGNLTIPSGVTLTLNSGALWAWNSGTSITVTGAIAVNGTATMQKGNLWYSGTTNATANNSTKIFDTASTKTGHMRVSAWFGFTGAFTDQNNVAQNATITSNTITVGDIVSSPTVTVSGGTMSINGDAFSATSRTISNGQTIAVRLTSSNQGGIITSVTVTLSGTGGDSATFNAETGCTPNACL